MSKNVETKNVVDMNADFELSLGLAEKIANALYAAAYIIGDIIPRCSERIKFLSDVCMAVVYASCPQYRLHQELYAPMTGWGRDWARRTGIMSDREISSKEIDDYLDELDAVRRIPASALYRDKSDGGKSKELYDLIVERAGLDSIEDKSA